MIAQKGVFLMGKDLGLRISDTLRKRGMTQKELAGRICVTEAVVSRYISGDRDPKPDVLANIATALHTTSDYLLGIEHEEFDHPRIRRMIARNASSMTEQEKKELIDALFGEE
jgi:transcriptional regulator with XRE-family HTH domain